MEKRLLTIIILCTSLCMCMVSCSDTARDMSGHDRESLLEYRKEWRRFNDAGKDDSLILYTRPILQKSLKNGDTLTSLYCKVYMAQAWLFMERTDSAMFYLDDVSQVIDSVDDNILKYLYYCIYGGCAIKAELNYTKAMECYLKGYHYAAATGNPGNQLSVLIDIIYIFYIRSDRQGMDYAREAYEIAYSPGESVDNKCSADVMMAMMSHICEDDQAALRYIDSAWKLARSEKIYTLFSLICKVYADIYSTAGQYELSEMYYKEALEYVGYADAGTETFVYLNYGIMLMDSKRYEKASEMFRKGLEVSYTYDNHECRKELLSSLIDNSLIMGRNDDAVRYLENYRAYLDSVSNRQREMEFNSMLMSIQKMEFENQAQASELRHLRARQRMMIYTAVLIIIIIVISFLLFISRRQRNTYKLLVEKYQRYAEQFNREAMAETRQDESKPPVNDADKELFEKVEKLMREQKVYRMKSLTRDSLAEMLGTNRTYLSRAVNSMSGKSFSDYLNTWRIIEATLIMADKSKDIPLKQLADDLGYSSISVFYRSFQKETGVTAGKYMREVRLRQS